MQQTRGVTLHARERFSSLLRVPLEDLRSFNCSGDLEGSETGRSQRNVSPEDRDDGGLMSVTE